MVDSHHELPRVTADEAALEEDIRPFRTLANAPMGMTCHLIYTAWDAERPATLSPTVIADVIRGKAPPPADDAPVYGDGRKAA